MSRFNHVLIANRGEIALRIMRSARALGYRVSAIYSEADAGAAHVVYADGAICVGPAPVAASYLNQGAILAAAQRVGADAIHPGYGLLSENAVFAQACLDAGLCFIGPRPETIRLMGNKRQARIAVAAHGVPCVPGYDGEDQSDPVLLREAARVGYPIMVKAAAGGGGRGMRRVDEPAELLEAITRARSEAEKAFGDGRLILERAIDGARHVEVQVFADAHGHVIHLGERDCSLQRRFQKLIEEAPSPAVDAALRERLGETAVRAARSAGYLGAGTVELLLAPNREFYFLEMNTRLQVEHPVTEAITGTDLVAWQLRVAQGEPLPITQDQLQLRGHAIEARLYAEDPARNFVPATGRILALTLPDPALARVDHWLTPGQEIGAHYDALLAKIICHGEDREQARRKLATALEQLRVLGLQTNQAFLRELVEHEVFAAGEATTDFLDRRGPQLADAPELGVEVLAAVAAAALQRGNGLRAPGVESASYAGELFGFTNCAGLALPLLFEHGDAKLELRVEHDHEQRCFSVSRGSQRVGLEIEQLDASGSTVVVDGVRRRFEHAWSGCTLHLHADGGPRSFEDRTYAPPRSTDSAGTGLALSPMDGAVVDVLARPGDRVERGQTLVVIEAMKLELRVPADVDGRVRSVHVERGAQVKARQILAEVEPETAL